MLILAWAESGDMHFQGNKRNGERYIVVIIPSYNNERWCKLNLESVFQQNYSNFHVVYIDDNSSDATYPTVQAYVQERNKNGLVTLIKNEERKGAMHNLYHAIHACDPHAIVATLDGDDWFKGNNVLRLINQAYSDPNVWMTYGQYEEFPANRIGICHDMPEEVIQEKSYRKQRWFTSHLRTFYAGLFHKIKEEDMKYEQRFFDVAWDQAFLFPMLEMADGHLKFIDQVLYVYNQANPLNDFKQKLQRQLYCERLIRFKKQYPALNVQEAHNAFVVV